MAMSKQDKNTAVITALGHPLRREILRHLEGNTNGGLSPNVLAKELNQPLGNVAYHVRVLAEAGVLKLAKKTPRRGAIEHFYKRAGTAVDQKVTEMLEFIGKD